ncbi:hypothetical protein C0992_010623 [Termitomyces sp. T32_za158]|nr:hypothetical protein C0992_010623 [Termitomyces sp. T32_za158]
MPLARRLSTRAPPDAPPPDHPVHASSTLTIVRAPESPRRTHRPVSFAATSFRPASPSATRPRPHLSPDQLVHLARTATHPPATATATAAPPTFTPLPDDILLPFIDRPAEVAALIASPPSSKLFTLLQKTLAPLTDPASDPAKWTYDQLHRHLTQVPRQHAADPLWVLQARRCIIAHSELIWERVKGALGVPPELDLDYDPSDSSSVDTDDISDDHGRSARGHWDDWDAIMDSPVHARRHSGPGSPIIPLSLSDSLLSIEPLLPTPHDASTGLGDIQESAEEDQDSETPDQPTHIQGLRISTTPVSLSPAPAPVPAPLPPISPLPPYVYPAPRSRPPSGSFSRPGSGFRRSASAGSLASSDPGHGHGHDPLFPSSFASLSFEPTLGHHA